MLFPDIKIKHTGLERAKQLKRDLGSLETEILKFAPKKYSKGRLQRLRIRIFPFPKEEDSNEYYFTHRNARYVCLNTKLLRRRYYAALQFALHGIAHSFCHLRDGIAQEAFCEYVGYSLLEKFLVRKGRKLTRRGVRSTMRVTSREYNNFFRAARKLDRKKPGILLTLNSNAKNGRLSKRGERNVVTRHLKLKRNFIEDDEDFKAPDLETRFRRV